MIKILPFKSEDYETLVLWWEKHKFPPVPLVALPAQTGFVAVKEDGTLLAAGFLYFTASVIAWLEWVVVNPDAIKEDRTQALDLLLKSITEVAFKLGFRSIFSSVKASSPLVNRLERHGFQKTDTEMTNLVLRGE